MEKVSVSKGLLVGLVAVSLTACLALAFLLGRASGPGIPPPQPPGRPLPAPASPLPETPAPDPSSPPPAPSAAALAEPASAPPPATAVPSLPEHGTGPRGDRGPAPERPDPDRAGVASYLQTVDRIHPGTKGGDAESVAGEMAAALAKGDTSSLDRMIRETEAARERLAALAPPESCAGHHRESLGSLDDALEMLRSLKKAMESPEPAAGLAGVASRATALRSRSEALQKEELALRQRYGLPR